jgi:hypothetical protein
MSESSVILDSKLPAVVPIPQQDRPLRVRFSPKERQRITEYLDLTQGHKCSLCPNVVSLEIDHKNGLGDQRLVSLRWLCKSCNLSQRNLSDSARLACVSVPSPHAETDPIAINRAKEPQWLNFCNLQLSHGYPVIKRVLKANSAFYCKISPATVDRYFVKYCAELGPFHEYTDTDGGEIVIGLRK